ncbi:DNA topoisomerase I [Rhizoctonia solani AG-1 IB]|uniref:DNA topoisomerase I n=1 Tax=Thanatephorus cucumeris (strain AG1-IB / isolate 7/3/14) TaxID=1108050 RepID=A0A0B7FT00_THACB|nr:DNA topoisomerase I [Rhizoctonia solani AG-1 IB]
MARRVTSDSESGDDAPLAQSSTATSRATSKRPRPSASADDAPVKRPRSAVNSDDSGPDVARPAKQVAAAAVPLPGAVKKTNGKARTPASKKDMTDLGRREAAVPLIKTEDGDVDMVDVDESDDEPLNQRIKAAANGKSKPKPKPKAVSSRMKARPSVKKESSDNSESDDEPLSQNNNGANESGEDELSASESESEPEVPLAKKKSAARKKVKQESDEDEDEKPVRKTPKKNGKAVKKEESDEDVKPAKGKGKVKKEDGDKKLSARALKKQKEEEEEAERFKWWETEALGDGTSKWTTLEHAGVLFPPPYEPLPKDVKMKYNGKPVDLPPDAEELAGWFGALLETEHAADEVFQKNFFSDWQAVLKNHPPRNGVVIKDFDKCDFRPMFEYFEAEKAKKKSMTAAEKKTIKEAKSKDEEKYTTCVMDGRSEKVGNFRIEPPGLFRGRGKHPKKGKHKYRLRPEDITINIGQNAPVPVPNIPGKWGKIQHDQTVTWLASWKENVNGNFKYVFLAAGSSLKGQSDMQKFEKARELKNHVDRIREDYTRDLKNKTSADRQRATAMYFIDRLALRAGNEKGEDEADTVGCCSLRYEHIMLEPPNKLIFDFLGKDSIRYYNVVEVEPQIFKNIRIFKGDGKGEGDALFDRVSTGGLNKHLNSYMKGLSAKVFRTYNASITFQKQLDENTPADADITQKLAAYNRANRMVAILCNHQKSVSKNHDASMGKLSDQLKGLKYSRMKLRHQLFTLDKKLKKKYSELDELESDLDDEFIERWEDAKREEEIAKARKKFEKDNEKRVEKGEKEEKESALDEKIDDINAEYDRLKEERGTDQAVGPKGRTPEKVLDAIAKLDEKIKMFKFKMQDKEEGKEVALGTSKINYLDPRITAAWCKKHDVPIEKIFAKTLLNKFPWAMEIDEDWKF